MILHVDLVGEEGENKEEAKPSPFFLDMKMKFHLFILSMDDKQEDRREFAFTRTSDKACGFPGEGGIQPRCPQCLCEGSLKPWLPVACDKGPRRLIYWPLHISQRAAGFQACSSFTDNKEHQAHTHGLSVGREG